MPASRDCAASITARRSLSLPRFARRLRLGVEPGAEPRPDIVEPVGDDAGEIRLTRAQPFRQARDPAVELGARFASAAIRSSIASCRSPPPRARAAAPPRRARRDQTSAPSSGHSAPRARAPGRARSEQPSMTAIGEAGHVMNRRDRQRRRTKGTHLTAPVPAIIVPTGSKARSMALRPNHHSARPQAAPRQQKVERVDDGSAPPDGRHDRDHARGAGRRPRCDPGRRADPPPRGRRRQEGRAACAANFVNPEIVWSSEEARPTRRAACRFPNITRRSSGPPPCAPAPSTARGEPREILAEGLLATVLQHEIDHLNGVLFIDHISKLKRDRVIKKFQKGRQARRRRLHTCCKAAPRRREHESGSDKIGVHLGFEFRGSTRCGPSKIGPTNGREARESGLQRKAGRDVGGRDAYNSKSKNFGLGWGRFRSGKGMRRGVRH